MKNQKIWIVFSVIFLILSIFHLYQSTQNIPKPENKAHVKSINGLNLGISEFVLDFNKYLEKLNNDNRKINIITCIGYLIACLTSIYSYYLSL
jgi:hypothetical protein